MSQSPLNLISCLVCLLLRCVKMSVCGAGGFIFSQRTDHLMIAALMPHISVLTVFLLYDGVL